MRRVTDQPLSLELHVTAVESARRGAVAVFLGEIRDHDPEIDGTVATLDYTAHPSAEEVLTRVADAVAAEHDVTVAVSHRIGTLAVGDVALVAAVGGDHRGPAFTAVEALVERVKAEVPIWKHQHNVEGVAVWSGLEEQS